MPDASELAESSSGSGPDGRWSHDAADRSLMPLLSLLLLRLVLFVLAGGGGGGGGGAIPSSLAAAAAMAAASAGDGGGGSQSLLPLAFPSAAPSPSLSLSRSISHDAFAAALAWMDSIVREVLEGETQHKLCRRNDTNRNDALAPLRLRRRICHVINCQLPTS